MKKNLLYHFKDVSGNGEKIEKIIMCRRQKEDMVKAKQEKKIKTEMRKIESNMRSRNHSFVKEADRAVIEDILRNMVEIVTDFRGCSGSSILSLSNNARNTPSSISTTSLSSRDVVIVKDAKPDIKGKDRSAISWKD